VRLSLLTKGLILVTLPFLTLLSFIVVGIRVGQAGDVAQGKALSTKDVLAGGRAVLLAAGDVQRGCRGYVLTRDPALAEPFDRGIRELPESTTSLTALVGDDPARAARAERIRAAADAVLTANAEIVGLFRSGEIERALDRVKTGSGDDEIRDLRRETEEFLQDEEHLEDLREKEFERTRRTAGLLFWSATAAVFAVTVGVAYVFNRGISRRFESLVETTRRLAAGTPLSPPLGGADELARLDAAIRDMAEDLHRAADRLRASARNVRDLYDQAPCGYHSVDASGTLVAMNQTELHWLGYSAGEVIGRLRFADVVAPAGRDAYRAAFERVKASGSAGNVELGLTRKDGSTFPVLLSSAAVRDHDGHFLMSRSTINDISDRKRAEDEVLRLNAELEARVRDRTTELAEANRELRQKNDENEMFVYSVSHDLRSPLVNLQGFSSELAKAGRALTEALAAEGIPADAREKVGAIVDGKMAKSLGFIRAAVLRLGAIIDALLRLSRAGRVDYRWEWVDTGRVVARILDATQAVIAEKGASVTVGELPPVWGDATAVEQLFANLIGNALTYLDPGRPGSIEVGCRDTAEGPVYFVCDNGLGIAASHQPKVFQLFQRAHPGVGTGEGIGLAIVARVAERHRGRVWVESAAGEGSTFFVTFRAGPDDTAGRQSGSGVVACARTDAR
jgi:PAS domain S-box-containing protein